MKKTVREEIYDAFYQYLLDHSYPTPLGTAVSMLLIKRNELHGKIAGRKQGYRRKTETEVEMTLYKYLKAEKIGKERSKIFDRLGKNGDWKIKLAFWVKHKVQEYLEKKVRKELNFLYYVEKKTKH